MNSQEFEKKIKISNNQKLIISIVDGESKLSENY